MLNYPPYRVIPAQAGIHFRMLPRTLVLGLAFSMDSGLRRNDTAGGKDRVEKISRKGLSAGRKRLDLRL